MPTVEQDILYSKSPFLIKDGWQHLWYDLSHSLLLFHEDGYFYALWCEEEQPTLKLLYHKSNLTSNLLLARLSLNEELLAIQTASNTILIADVSSRKTWLVDTKASILPEGIIWSEHGGGSQDLICITTGGMELFKITSKRATCRLSRLIAQPAMTFWYNPHHRLVLLGMTLGSHNNGNSSSSGVVVGGRGSAGGGSAAVGSSSSSSGNAGSGSASSEERKLVWQLDGFFLKTEKASMPSLELPPPDRLPAFQLGPGVDREGIHLVSIYGQAILLVHSPSGGEAAAAGGDAIIAFQLSGSSSAVVSRLFSISLGVAVPAVRISILDNLLLLHLPSKQSLVFDLQCPVKRRNGSLEALARCTLTRREERKTQPAASLAAEEEDKDNTSSSREKNDTDNKDWQAVLGSSLLPPDLRDVNTLRFLSSRSSTPQGYPSPTLSSSNTGTGSERPLSRPPVFLAFYFPALCRCLGERLALECEARVLWRLAVDLPALVTAMDASPEEKAAFLSRRGRVYRLPRPARVKRADRVAQESSRLAKFSLLRLLLHYLEDGAATGVIQGYSEAMMKPYLEEFHRIEEARMARRAGGGGGADLSRRASLSEIFSARLSSSSRKGATGSASRGGGGVGGGGRVLGWLEQEEEVEQQEEEEGLEPFGIPSALFSEITALGLRVAAWKERQEELHHRPAALSRELDRLHRLRSRSAKAVHDGSLLLLRRSPQGDLLTTQTELVALVWVPFLSRCRDGFSLWAGQLGGYLAALQEEEVPRCASLSVLHLHLLFYSGDYHSILQALRLGLYSDAVEVAFVLLQFSDSLQEEEGVSSLLGQEGVDMLWRLNEKVAVVKWLLGRGRVAEAMDLCRTYSSSTTSSMDNELSSRYISGIDFFSAAVKVVESQSRKGQEEDGLLFWDVFNFLSLWDEALLVKLPVSPSLPPPHTPCAPIPHHLILRLLYCADTEHGSVSSE